MGADIQTRYHGPMRHPANSWAVAVPVAAALAIGLGATALFDPASAGSVVTLVGGVLALLERRLRRRGQAPVQAG